MSINWKRAIGYGALIWLIMFAVASAIYRLPPLWMSVAIIVLMVALAYVFAGKVGVSTAMAGFWYGLTWAVTGLVLDAVVTVQFVQGLYGDWLYWVSYLLVVAAPVARALIATKLVRGAPTTGKPTLPAA